MKKVFNSPEFHLTKSAFQSLGIFFDGEDKAFLVVQNIFLSFMGEIKRRLLVIATMICQKKIYFGGTASVSGMYNGMISFLNDHSYFYMCLRFHKVWLNTELQLLGVQKREQTNIQHTVGQCPSMTDYLGTGREPPGTRRGFF